MLKSAMLLSTVLCIGILLGLSLATLSRSAPAIKSPVVQSDPLPATVGSTTDQPSASFAPSPPVSTLPAMVEALQNKLSHLTAQLHAATVAQQQWQDELRLVKDTVTTLEQRLEALAEAEPEEDPQPAAAEESQRSEADTLVAAGFDLEEAQYLVNRWGQQQMDLLYLRDQATREGWINTPRYEQAAQDLRSGIDSIREELGPDAYDRFLYASGRPNRVVLSSIMDSSPAQIIGLQPGDTILSYDDQRIFSMFDLRQATTTGEPGAPVAIEVDRNGQRLNFEIARGPIGVTLGNRREEP